MSDDYICKIGLATENTAKLALFEFLQKEYSKYGHSDVEFPLKLAGGVTDKVFGEQVTEEPKLTFATQHTNTIEEKARAIASNEALCQLLTGAAYNTCYARYLNAGGKRSMFSNPFLAYIRAGRDVRSRSSRQIALELHIQITGMDDRILAPIEAMQTLNIFRELPYSPNERQFYLDVRRFAEQVGLKFET